MLEPIFSYDPLVSDQLSKIFNFALILPLRPVLKIDDLPKYYSEGLRGLTTTLDAPVAS